MNALDMDMDIPKVNVLCNAMFFLSRWYFLCLCLCVCMSDQSHDLLNFGRVTNNNNKNNHTQQKSQLAKQHTKFDGTQRGLFGRY